MKRAGIITTATVAALVLAGGGVVLGMNLAGSDEPADLVTETTPPAASATPETTPDETATAEPTESTIPTATAYTEKEQQLLYYARFDVTNPGVTDEQILAATQLACEDPEYQRFPLEADLPGTSDVALNNAWATMRAHGC